MVYMHDWPAVKILVGYTTHGSSSYRTVLLDCVSQARFIEYVMDTYERPPATVHAMQLTDDSFDLLEDYYRNNNILLEGD